MTVLGYLVIREGTNWNDVFRLIPGQVVTIGRAPSNQVVVKDERCSRAHAELYEADGRWILRDLGSRNGTLVGDQLVEGEQLLKSGDIVRIGHSQLMFVNQLSEAFGDGALAGTDLQAGSEPPPPAGTADENTSSGVPAELIDSTTTITHRSHEARLLTPGREDDGGISRFGRAAARLCRLAIELGKAPDAVAACDLALRGLCDATHTDAGGVLLLPPQHAGKAVGEHLELIASYTSSPSHYHRVSSFLASMVLREGEAVLARNIQGDSALGQPDTQGLIRTTSAMCAPIRRGSTALGLVHLYSTSAERVPDPDDLEFTLAVADALAVALGNLQRRQELADDLTQVRTEIVQLRERLGVTHCIVGHSSPISKIKDEIALAAASKATVLIRGESGVGKELVARAIHDSSARCKNVFVCLNCAALSEELLASELFGHERGAFTGATERKIGKFEAAHKGTLMLDEIGEMSPGIQAKFLRVLEGHTFERVGGSKPITADVRVLSATNRDLEQDVADGRFRRDLYFRLHVLEIVVPPLRKRPEDIPELAQHFLERYKAETGKKIRGFTPDALDQLVRYRWPGNVREMKNVIERAVVLCAGTEIQQSDLALSKLSTAGDTGEIAQPGPAQVQCSLAEVERQHILAILNHTGWNKSRAASILGIERSTLDRKIRRYLAGQEPPGP